MAVATLKPRIFVTGSPGVGKTTLIVSVLESLRKAHDQLSADLRIHGFYTREVRDSQGGRVGFEAIVLDGRKAPLATTATIIISPTSSSIASRKQAAIPKVGKYNVNVAQFEALVLPELAVSPSQDSDPSSDLFVIDEVGKMDLFSPAFFPAVWEILDSRAAAVLGSIPVPTKNGREIPEVERIKKRAAVAIYTLTKSNRDAMTSAVLSHLTALLKKS